MSEASISAETIINDAVTQYPQTLPVFQAAGIDTCCGGSLPIAEASRRHGIDADELLKSIELAIAGSACTL
jgi:iron-sulfur cluster repair protein YtfE (RIC family)